MERKAGSKARGVGFASVFMIVLLAAGASAEAPYSYYLSRTGNLVPLPYGPVALPGPTSGLWTNPAGVGADESSGLLFTKPSSADGYSDFFSDDLAWGVNAYGLGFGIEYLNGGGMAARRYTWAVNPEIVEGVHLGTAYHWSSGLNRQNSWDFGLLVRPTRWLSIGGTATELIGGDMGVPGMSKQDVDATYRAGLAVRPLGPWLSLTGDLMFSKIGLDGLPANYGDDMDPTFTASVMPVDGITLRGGYALDSETVFAGLSLSFGMSELGGWSGFDNDPATGQPDDAGATWIRCSSRWEPAIIDVIGKKKVVKMELSGQLVEEPQPFSFFHKPDPTLLEKIDQLDRIANDDKVSGVWIEISGLSAQFADLQELRVAIQRVEAAGKTVVVYAEDLSFGQYYLACAADKIYLQPTGIIAVPGIDYESLHLKRLLDKIHVTPQVERIGKYKSAAELFVADSSSAEAEEAMNAILDDWWSEWVDAVAEGRGVTHGEVEEWVNDVIHNGGDAAVLGMIDGAVYADEMRETVKDDVGGNPQIVSAGNYFEIEHADLEWEDMTSPKIAVIYAEGMILSGESGRIGFTGEPAIGSETLSKMIREAREDHRVKAIVMRVDSPGGSGLASDVIAREVQRTTHPEDKDVEPKPFIVSMSGVAASGGYYISCFADDIIAPSTSITGSIGVLAMNLGYHDLLDTLGIHYDPNYRGRNAGMFNGRVWNDEQQQIIFDEIKSHYDVFIGHVAEGREMTVEDVDAIAQGRVWSGGDAVGNKLIDGNGGFYDAIRLAKQSIGVDPDEDIELELYYPGSSWSVDSEFNMLASNLLPESVKTLLVREQLLEALDSESVNMIAPLDPQDLYME